MPWGLSAAFEISSSDFPAGKSDAATAGVTCATGMWIRSLQDQCRQARIAFFVKQLGSIWSRQAGAASPKGGDPGEWPAELRIREFPEVRE